MIAGGKLVVVLRLRDRVDARARRRAPEPAADVALDRLAVQALPADALDQQRHRHLPFAEAWNPCRGGEVVGGVLDGVVDVVRRNLDRELDLVVSDLFDRIRHPVSH